MAAIAKINATSGEKEMIEVNTIKKVSAVVLILLTSGTWFYLDKLNNGEQMAAEQLHRDLEQTRSQAKTRAEIKAKFESQILVDLTTCQSAAEKAGKDYLNLIAQAVPPRKNVPFTMPQSVIDEASKTLAAAKAECQATYDTRFKNG
jgi:hypothetical protein